MERDGERACEFLTSETRAHLDDAKASLAATLGLSPDVDSCAEFVSAWMSNYPVAGIERLQEALDSQIPVDIEGERAIAHLFPREVGAIDLARSEGKWRIVTTGELLFPSRNGTEQIEVSPPPPGEAR